ncbi:endo-1,4-beta-xylanase [Nesterenkonia sp. PF2B19]|uniref:endo-1,4-beta-xylanase n=1 Tax=Nesterenkonia sp. PF2B19 TaxID=1881858 RepID=UPI000872ED11|nr:endo-1,4-beta-xylanase [Nesterenkonia sp. PF2B19]
MTYENYPALKDQYEDYFHFGIFGRGEMEGLIYNYASYTPGNEMKPESTQPEKGVFTFENAEAAMAQHAEHNPDLLFSGHTLAWHSQTPSWMWDAPPARYGQPGEYDPAVAQENLETHIEEVLGHFGEDLQAIDVVNEAIESADPSDWRASLTTGQGWYPALGPDWVEMAFLKAAEVVDENGWDVKLTYNDFGLNNPDKARVVHDMVREINETHEGLRPDGKQLIEVIGMQGHYGLNTDVSDVEENIQLFATLPGVEIHITEMDVGVPPGEFDEVKENNQGVQYAELFRIFRDYAIGPGNTTDNPKVISTVKLAGVRDVMEGWRGGEYAMPYDVDGHAKKALLGILWPEEFLAEHEWIEPDYDDGHDPIDGVHVYHAEHGDGYTGANIILGNDSSQWPWSTAGEDGQVAFDPEPDATYRLTVTVTPAGTTSVRIRWIHDESNGGYTSGDGAAVNDHQYSASEVASHIPAYFNRGLVNMGTYDLVTEFTMDGTEPADGLIGNIAVRGGGGGSAYTINSITVEKVDDDGDDELLVNWPEGLDEDETGQDRPGHGPPSGDDRPGHGPPDHDERPGHGPPHGDDRPGQGTPGRN